MCYKCCKCVTFYKVFSNCGIFKRPLENRPKVVANLKIVNPLIPRGNKKVTHT